jgi:L-ascorbate metabolism protein UlaG (beta-lactamase superfamily)
MLTAISTERTRMATLTWLGHASFRIDTDDGKRIYVDPFLQHNPKTPDDEKQPDRVDVIAVTHGHGDHTGDTVELSKRFPDAEIVAQVELKAWLGKQGANIGELPGPNKGGTQEVDGVRFTLVNAFHSSSSDELEYLGESCGIVVRLPDGKSVYFAGDTCVFGDMQLIARLYEPDVAVLPIGDHFTMGPEEAAVALELLGNPRCVPCHFGTFGLLTGTPDALSGLTSAQVERLEPGESIDL